MEAAKTVPDSRYPWHLLSSLPQFRFPLPGGGMAAAGDAIRGGQPHQIRAPPRGEAGGLLCERLEFVLVDAGERAGPIQAQGC